VGRALRLAAAAVVAVGAVVVLLLVLQSRDKSTFSGDVTSAAPGRLLPDQGNAHTRPPAGFRFASDPPASGPHLPVHVPAEGTLSRDALLHAVELGDVVFAYGDPADAPLLRGLRDDVAGADPALVAAGQAIVLDLRPGTAGVIAVGWRRLLRVAKATDPRLRAFADAQLGHGAAR
jgi:hypothetical protein